MKIGDPLPKEESDRLLKKYRESVSHETKSTRKIGPPVDLNTLPQSALLDIAKRLSPDARHAVFKGMYGQPIPIEEPTFLESVGHGLMRLGRGYQQGVTGIKDKIQGTNKLTALEDEVQREFDLYQQGRGPDAGFDAGAFVGQLVPAAGVGALMGSPTGLLPAIGLGALEGGAISGLDYTEKGDSTLRKVIEGAAFGAAMPPALAAARGLGGAVGRALTPKAGSRAAIEAAEEASKSAVPGGTINLEGLKKAAQQQLEYTGNLADDVLARRARLESLGFTGGRGPTTGQLTQNNQLFADEQNMRHFKEVGEELNARFNNQLNYFNDDLFPSAVVSTGARNAGQGQAEYAGQGMVDAVIRRWNTTGKAIGRLYRGIENKYGDIGGITIDDVVGRTKELGQDTSMGDVTNSVFNRLRALGLIDADNNPSGATLTVSQARGLRTWIGNLSNKGSNKHAKREIIGSLDDSVVDATGDDYFKSARDQFRARAVEYEKDTAKRILSGSLQGNQMINTLRNASTNRLEDLKWTLDHSGKLGRQAWDEGRGQLLYDLFKDGPNKTLVNRLDKMGDKKLKFLYPESFDQIKAVRQSILDLRVGPPDSPINRSFTAPTALNMVSRIPLPLAKTVSDVVSDTFVNKAKQEAVRQSLAGNAVDVAAGRIGRNPSLSSLYGSLFPTLAVLNAERERR